MINSKIRRVTLSSFTALSLLVVTAQAEGMMKCQAGGKCGGGMMKQAKQGAKMQKHSPFLIKHGLPHLTKLLVQNWDDTKLALTKEQKEALMKVREETKKSVMGLKPEVATLTDDIVQASKSGSKASDLKEKVDKLASLEAEATITHLKCIENTKAILKPEQLEYLMSKVNQ